MKIETYYQLEPNDRDHAKRIGECLNMLGFVFTHNPELRIVPRQVREGKKMKKPTDYFNPHSKIFQGGPFTLEQVKDWSDWVNQIIAKGAQSVQLQHPAYRTGHLMALQRLREDADAFLDLFPSHPPRT